MLTDKGYRNLRDPIPMYIAGYGPKAQALAGEIADGLTTNIPRGGTLDEILAKIEKMASESKLSVCRILLKTMQEKDVDAALQHGERIAERFDIGERRVGSFGLFALLGLKVGQPQLGGRFRVGIRRDTNNLASHAKPCKYFALRICVC